MHRDLAVRSLALAVATVAVGGCQVFQPYVMPRHYAESAPQGKPLQGKLCNDPSRYPVEAPPSGTTQGIQLGPEIAFARGVQAQLSCFARQHGEFAAAMGYGLIPLAALVSYKSFAGANPHHLAALAAGGAAGYGIARYQYRPRDLVYLGGVTAVDCAVQVAQPSILTPGQRASVETRQNELAKAAAGLDRAERALSEAAPGLDEAHRLIAGTGGRERKAANAIVAELRSLAAAVHDDVAALRERAGTASSQVASLLEYDFVARKDLVNTVEGIVHAVNMQIATQQPDAAVLASLVAPLKMPVAQAAQSNGGAATGPEKAQAIKQALNGLPSATYNVRAYARNKSGAETAEREDSRGKLLGLADKLADALHDVQEARRTIERVEAHLAALSTPTNLARLHKQCSIEVTAATALTVSLPKEGVSVPNGGAAVSVPVVGGSKPYSATVVDATAKGTLSADLKVGTGDAYTLALSAKDFAAPQKLRVMVQDAHGQAVEIAVQVLTK